MNTISIRFAQSADIETIYHIFSITDRQHQEIYPEVITAPESSQPIK